MGTMFVILKPFEERAGHDELYDQTVAARLTSQFNEVLDARSGVYGRRRSTAWAARAGSSCRCRTAATPDRSRCRTRCKP